MRPVAVAMPLRRWRKLRAMRSRRSTSRALPRTVSRSSPPSTRSPSRSRGKSSTPGASDRKSSATTGRPQTTPGFRGLKTARTATGPTSPLSPKSPCVVISPPGASSSTARLMSQRASASSSAPKERGGRVKALGSGGMGAMRGCGEKPYGAGGGPATAIHGPSILAGGQAKERFLVCSPPLVPVPVPAPSSSRSHSPSRPRPPHPSLRNRRGTLPS